MMLCRADALLLGVLAAVLLRNDRWRERIRGAGLAFSVLIPILLLGMAFLTVRAGSMTTAINGERRVLPGWRFSTLTILLFVLTRPNSSLTKVLRMKWLCWLGTLAYGIYLFHQRIQNLLFAIIWGHGIRNNRWRNFHGGAGGGCIDASCSRRCPGVTSSNL